MAIERARSKDYGGGMVVGHYGIGEPDTHAIHIIPRIQLQADEHTPCMPIGGLRIGQASTVDVVSIRNWYSPTTSPSSTSSFISNLYAGNGNGHSSRQLLGEAAPLHRFGAHSGEQVRDLAGRLRLPGAQYKADEICDQHSTESQRYSMVDPEDTNSSEDNHRDSTDIHNGDTLTFADIREMGANMSVCDFANPSGFAEYGH